MLTAARVPVIRWLIGSEGRFGVAASGHLAEGGSAVRRVVVSFVVLVFSLVVHGTASAKSLRETLAPPMARGTFLEGTLPTSALGNAISTQFVDQLACDALRLAMRHPMHHPVSHRVERSE